MILDFVDKTSLFVLRVPRSETDIRTLMRDHGLDLSLPGSTPSEAMLFTGDPYAACTFWPHATPGARAALAPIQAQIDASWAPSSGRHYRVPADMSLWPFQAANLDYCLSRRNTLIADQPGLGKTPTAIAFCNEVRAKRVLVLCPANIRLQWVKRIREWTTMQWPYGIHCILTSRSGVHPTAAWTVTSYEMARQPAIAKALAKGLYDVLILDEVHMLKTVSSLRTRSIFGGGTDRAWEPLASRCERILALTGTPLPNRPREAYTIAKALCLDGNTQVVTNNGVRALREVRKDDLLWDGQQWVKHAGVIYKGFHEAPQRLGVSATPDHKIFLGQQSRPWSDLLADASILSLALAHGRESLKLLATHQARAGQILSSDAPAAWDRIASFFTTGATENACVAKNAATENLGNWHSSNMAMKLLSPTSDCATGSSTGYPQRSADVIIPRTKDTSGTGNEVFPFGRNGRKTATRTFDTFLNSLDAGSPEWTLTEKIIAEDMSREIFGLLTDPSTPKINAASSLSNDECGNWKHVFDIVNAGPKRRFTILCDGGALVVSNCWDAIDWQSEDAFKERYNPSAVREVVDRYGRVKKFIDERTGRHAELQNRLRANFMVRHLKADVLTQLPEVMHDVVQLEETGPVKQALKAESMLDIDPETLTAADMTIMGHISQVRHMMGVALAPQAADYVAGLLDGGEEKILVFAHHLAVLDILEEKLGRHGVARIDGGSSMTQRTKAVKDFREDPEIKVMVGNLQSMGTGTDGLQDVCSHSVFAECSWVHGENQQGIDRLHRMGQKSGVLAEFLVAPGSISEKVLANSLRKGQSVHKALDAGLII